MIARLTASKVNGALAALLVLALILLAVLLVGGSRVLPWTTDAEKQVDTYADVQAAATRAVLAFLDVDYQHMDEKQQAVEALSTGSFKQQYAGTAPTLKAAAEQAKAVSNYSNSILANMEATDDGYDEALLLDSSGFVSEGAGENIFIVKNGVIYTPDLSAGALNGITRNTVFHIAKDLGLEIVQKRITRDEVYIADEAFFTGTAAEVTPIRELDRIELGKEDYVGSRGPITEKIQSAFFDIVNGRNPKYAHWLTKV